VFFPFLEEFFLFYGNIAQFEQSFTHHSDENETGLLTFICPNSIIANEKTITRRRAGIAAGQPGRKL